MKSVLRLAGKMARREGALPEVVTVFVTHRCNADCSFCFFADSLNKPVDELSAVEWTAVARSMSPFSLLILTGGEPFLRHDLPEIAIAFAREAGAENIAIPTNGYQSDAVETLAMEVLTKTPVRTLCVSLSIDAVAGKHDELRRVPGGYERILRTAARLRELRRRFPKRLLLHTATVFSAVNQNGVEATLREIEQVVEPDSMGLTLVREPYRGPHREGLDVALYRRLNVGLAERSVSRRYHAVGAKLHRAKTDRVLREQIEGRYVSPCFAGQLSATIRADGFVPLCERRGEKMGSLRDVGLDFPKLWHSALARERSRLQRSERCFCGHECYVTPNILFNPGQLLKALVV